MTLLRFSLLPVFEKLLADLKAWEKRLDNLFEGKPMDAFDFTLAESLKMFPGKKDPYYDMIEVRFLKTN